MAANKEEMNKAEEMNKTEMKKKLDVSSQDKFITNVIKHTNTFLTTPELARFRQASKKIYGTGTLEALARKKLSEELLHYVFQADPEEVTKYFANCNSKGPANFSNRKSFLKLILEKTAYREGYYSEKLKLENEKKAKKAKKDKVDKEDNFVLFRHWPNISPLQAAALSGDNFLVRNLLTYIIDDEIGSKDPTLRLKAATQLQEIIKSKDYLISFNELIKAYDEFLKLYDEFLIQYNNLVDPGKEQSEALVTLWEKVGECQKRLSRYGWQEFFDRKQLKPLLTFESEPLRVNEMNIDLALLDSIGKGSLSGLVAFAGIVCRGRVDEIIAGWGMHGPKEARHDLEAINILCTVRKTELENIIKSLEDHKAALISIVLNMNEIEKDMNGIEKQKP